MSPRPDTLAAVAARADSLAAFGRHLRDWLHQLRRCSARPQAAAAIADEPELLRGRFPGGHVADAWLGAYADHLAGKLGRAAPEWAFRPERVAPDPVFDVGELTPRLRWLALREAPGAFKRRNLYPSGVDLPLRLRAGRPAKSAEEKRQTNAERQRRFRHARRVKAFAALGGSCPVSG